MIVPAKKLLNKKKDKNHLLTSLKAEGHHSKRHHTIDYKLKIAQEQISINHRPHKNLEEIQHTPEIPSEIQMISLERIETHQLSIRITFVDLNNHIHLN